MNKLARQDIVEKRAKCVVCGYELTYPEYVNDDRCVFHTEKQPIWGLISWIRFSIAEYRVMRFKSRIRLLGGTEHDYIACVGLHAEDIGNIKTAAGMEALCKELEQFKMMGSPI